MINERLLREEGKPATTCVYVYKVVHPYDTWWVMEHDREMSAGGRKRYEAPQWDDSFHRAMNVAFDIRLLPIFVRLSGRCRGFVKIDFEDPPLFTARHGSLDWFVTSRSRTSVTDSILRLMIMGPPHWCLRPEERAIELS